MKARKFKAQVKNMTHRRPPNVAARPFHSAPYVELHQSFRSQIPAISPAVAQVMRFMRNFRKADGKESQIETALREALANAVIHGNGENSSECVYVDCRCYLDGEVLITVRDEGAGFDTSNVADPTRPENRLLTHGRGIYLMKALMDEVSFESGGAVVYMRKKANSGSAHRGVIMRPPRLKVPSSTALGKGDSNEHFRQRLDREEKPNAKAVHDHRTALV